MSEETAHVFQCGGDELLGIYHPARTGEATVGVLIVVGGPQYRVGSHRMFVRIARDLAFDGIDVLRFDYRGMGDSAGTVRTFDTVSTDIKAAVAELRRLNPALVKVVLLGLCDAASAALIYIADGHPTDGLILLNPWVRSAQGMSRARLWYYYPKRLVDKVFWKKLLTGRVRILGSLRDLLTTIGATAGVKAALPDEGAETSSSDPSFIERMRAGFEHFEGRALVLLSADDLTAQEYQDLSSSDSNWRRLMSASNVETRILQHTDHTLSDKQGFTDSLQIIRAWLKSIA